MPIIIVGGLRRFVAIADDGKLVQRDVARPNDRRHIIAPSARASSYRELLQSARPRFPRIRPWPSARRRCVQNDFSQKRTRQTGDGRPLALLYLPVPPSLLSHPITSGLQAGQRSAPPTLLACFTATLYLIPACSPAPLSKYADEINVYRVPCR